MTAEAHSLVEWVNSFEVGECGSLRELSSGAILFKCMKNVIPDLSLEGDGEYWDALFLVLSEFCECSLECVSRQMIVAGDEDHIARAVVLLLCLAVQRKPNEDVISRITTLQYKAQCDIMFFIEEALAKMKSNALGSGLFTSGVGDMVPSLSEKTDTPTEKDREVGGNELMEQGQGEEEGTWLNGGNIEISGRGLSQCVTTLQATPNRLTNKSNLFRCPSSVPRSMSRHQLSRTSYYQGLESPAAVQWMQSQKKKPRTRQEIAANNSPALPEEVLKLQHRVRVLEKSLLNEQALSQEMHTALCQREREFHELEASYQQLQVMAEKANELSDVQDELETVTKELEKSKKNVQRLQREVEEQQTSQEKMTEEKTVEMSRLETENTHLKELLEKTVADQLEQKSDLKRLQLSSETAAIAFQAKQHECDSLLQMNRESSAVLRELKEQTASYQQELSRLEETSHEREMDLTEENHALSLKITQIQEQLEALKDEQRVLVSDCESAKQQLTVAEAGSSSLLEQYQAAVSEREGLRTHCKMMESQLSEVREEEEQIKIELQERHVELESLKNDLAEVREKYSKLEHQWSEKEATFVEQERVLKEHILSLEDRCAAAECGLSEKEEALQQLQKESCQNIQYLQENIEQMKEELARKETEFCNLSHTAAEQKHQTEELLFETRQKLNLLTEKYTTEAEEMAAVKASLEEDLARVHSELREVTRSQTEKEKLIVVREKEMVSTRDVLNTELQRVHSVVERLEKEKTVIVTEKEGVVNQLKEMTAWIEVKEQRWAAEKAVLETRVVELSCELENVKETTTESLQAVEKKHKVEESHWREEKEGYVIQIALLEDQVAGLTMEMEATENKSEDYRREMDALRAVVDETESKTQSLQAEYQSMLAEMERSQQLYSSDLTALKEVNTLLQQQQSEASTENGLILQKQSELYEELSQLQQTKSEAMELCRQYENMYNEERKRHQVDREQIRKMRMQGISDSKSTTMEVDSLRKQLSGEKRTMTRLGAENRSLKAQVSFLEQKLRDIEKEQQHQIPSLTKATIKRVSQSTFISQPRSSTLDSRYPPPGYQPHTEEFYSKLQQEFNSSSSTQIPVNLYESQSHNHVVDEDASIMTVSGPQHQSTAVKSLTRNHTVLETQQSQQCTAVKQHDYDDAMLHSEISYSYRSMLAPEKRERDDTGRISELKSRNNHVLPHLKSSYAVELQEKTEDPGILPGQTRRPQRKRPVGNTATIKLTNESVLIDNGRKRSTTSRRTAGELSFSGSPAPSRRRISEPTPPKASSTLRENKDNSNQRRGSPRDTNEENDEPEQYPPGTMFEMNFSPPTHSSKVSAPPERLARRLKKQEKPVPTTSESTNTSDVRGGKKSVSTRATHKTTRKRTVLKTKN